VNDPPPWDFAVFCRYPIENFPAFQVSHIIEFLSFWTRIVCKNSFYRYSSLLSACESSFYQTVLALFSHLIALHLSTFHKREGSQLYFEFRFRDPYFGITTFAIFIRQSDQHKTENVFPSFVSSIESGSNSYI